MELKLRFRYEREYDSDYWTLYWVEGELDGVRFSEPEEIDRVREKVGAPDKSAPDYSEGSIVKYDPFFCLGIEISDDDCFAYIGPVKVWRDHYEDGDIVEVKFTPEEAIQFEDSGGSERAAINEHICHNIKGLLEEMSLEETRAHLNTLLNEVVAEQVMEG